MFKRKAASQVEISIFLIAALSAVSGCATGQNKDNSQSQKVSAPAANAEATKISDNEINSTAANHLFKDRYFSPQKITINTNDGIVTLSGEVNNLRSKDRAVRTVENIRGVRGVVNQLQVIKVSKSDEQIRKDVETALLLDAATESYEVDPSVKDGVVKLKGTVDSWAERTLAAWVAKGVRGVRSVSNEISVQFAAERPPSEISQDIKGALKTDPLLAAETIAIDIIDDKAFLSGTVGSAAQKSRIYSKSWVAGVKDVDVTNVKVDSTRQKPSIDPRQYTDVSDAAIKDAVVDALVYDPRVYSFNPEVTVKNKIVTLSGTVSSLKAKRAAQDDAENVIGVYGVVNNLRVQADRPDSEIAKDVRSLLLIDPVVDKFQIKVSSQKGIVRLEGAVDTFFEKWHAEDVASRVESVVDVQNNLRVPSGFALSDDPGIKMAVEQNLRRNILFDGDDQVNVSVDNGNVTLTGVVDNWTEHTAATTEAFQGGAVSVYNSVTVRGAPPNTRTTYFYSQAPNSVFSAYFWGIDDDAGATEKSEEQRAVTEQ